MEVEVLSNTNQACRSFFKRTRKGNVVQITRERYIRESQCYGYLHKRALSKEKLMSMFDTKGKAHLLVLDTNVALLQIDLFESKLKDSLKNVVVSQTVLQEVQHLNQAVYRRLCDLLRDENRPFIFFPNEVTQETATTRARDESPNDANDRAIRLVAKFFRDGLQDQPQIKVILISNDVKNRQAAEKDMELQSLSMQRYVHTHFGDRPELLDLLSQEDYTADQLADAQRIKEKEKLFDAHLSMEQISEGLRTKRFLRGTLRVRRDDSHDCYAIVHGGGNDGARQTISVTGKHNVNRAVDGDIVALELTKIDEMEIETKKGMETKSTSLSGFRTDDGAGAVKETLDADLELLEGLKKNDDEPMYGRVVGIIRRRWRQYAGSLGDKSDDLLLDATVGDGSEGNTGEPVSAIFIPMDKKIPKIRITTRRRPQLTNCRILVAIDTWPMTSTYPMGHYVRSLGRDGDKDVETAVLLHEFDVPHEDFSTEVMSCLPSSNWKIGESDMKGRTDFRHLPIVSIDPPGCKDIDDALHCIRLPNGNFECGVHIADVTHFVKPDTPLDKEAAHRSTSTYLVERRLDMLPSLLTTELCSLRSHEDHLAFSVIWEIDPQLQVVNAHFTRSVIHSVAALTYDEAQAMLDEGDNENDEIGTSVRLLGHIARTLRARRIEDGALTLASPEVRFRLDDAHENPTDVAVYALKEANALVEEFMLFANITVSKKILRHFPALGVLRRHQPPSKEQFAPLMAAAAAVGVDIDITSSKTLSKSLDDAQRSDDPYFNKLIRILSTRCMMPAQYFCSGEVPEDQWWHYGLAAPIYSHFTSPIRRYADIVLHRLLAAAIGDKPLPPAYADRTKQQDLCSHMNRRHKAAQHASRASTNLHTLLYFKNRPTLEDGYVLSVAADRVVVLVPKYALEGTIALHRLADHFQGVLQLDSTNQSVAIKCKKNDEVVWNVQVLGKVPIYISVVETERERKLQLGLMVDGLEFAGTEGLQDGDVSHMKSTSSSKKRAADMIKGETVIVAPQKAKTKKTRKQKA